MTNAASAGRGAGDGAFYDWLLREIPPGTVISDGRWWAPRIARAYEATHPGVSRESWTLGQIEDAWGAVVPLSAANFDRFRRVLAEMYPAAALKDTTHD